MKRTNPTSQTKDQPTMVDAITQWQTAGLGALNWFGAPTIEHMSALGAEWMSFVAERVKEDVALQHSLLHAKSPEDVQHLQMTFLQKAMDQYAAETGKMAELSSKLFQTDEKGEEDLIDNVNV